MIKYELQAEKTPDPCGVDYETFIEGYFCKNKTSVVIVDVDNDNFHYAHLCKIHGNKFMRDLGN